MNRTNPRSRPSRPWLAALLWAIPLGVCAVPLVGDLASTGVALWAQSEKDDGYGPAPGRGGDGIDGKESPESAKEALKRGQPAPITPAVVPAGMVGPKLVIENPNYDWGTVLQGTIVEHVFKVSNPGDMDLILSVKPG
ncbi:MAG: hypothetical protein AB7O52_17600 [Planctomycetota bacterium]